MDQYLKELQASLRTLDHEDQESLEYYREYLMDGNFTSYQACVDELGDPQTLAKKILADRAVENDHAHIHFDTDNNDSMGNFKSILLDTSAKVTIRSGNEFKVVTHTPRGVTIKSQVENDQLKITQTGGNVHTKHFWFIVFKSYQVMDGKVTIYVPNDWKLDFIDQGEQNQSLNIKGLTFNHGLNLHGDIELEQVTAPYLKIESKIDDISVNECRFEDGESTIKTASGDIKVIHVKFDSIENIGTASGDCSVNEVRVTNGSTTIKSNSGDLISRNSKFNDFKMMTNAGDVRFNNLDIKGNFTAKSNVGDIEGSLMNKDHASVKAKSDLGDVNVNVLNDPDSEKRYHFSTNIGDITVR